MSAAAAKVRVDYRLDPELAAWVAQQAVDGRTKTDVVEQAIRLLREEVTGVSPAASRPSPPAKDPAGLARQEALNRGRERARR